MNRPTGKNVQGFGSPTRFRIFAAILSLAALVILYRYGSLMLGTGQTAKKVQKENTERGPILDSNGRILAMQTRLANVTIWRPEIQNIQELCAELAPLLELDPKELSARISSSQSDFLYAKKKVDQSTVAAIEQKRAEGKLAGTGIEPIVGRIYPEKRLASTLIGFVGDDNTGLGGIELAFEDSLEPAKGSSYGDQVFLTIDVNIQHMLEGIARDTLVKNGAEAVMLLAMRPATGEILGYVSLPDFDPNDIRSSTETDRMDRPAVWAYEPGSVFKMFSIASILELGGITPDTTFNCTGHYERTLPSGEKISIKCSAGAHGTVSAREIITYSCNTGTAFASERVESRDFADLLSRFGFGQKTGITLASETPGYIRPVEYWSGRSKQTIAIGQEVAVSALQILQAASAIANDGIMVQPRVVSKVVGIDGTLKKDYSRLPTRRVISAEHARELRSYMLTASSPVGTGRRASLGDLSIAVKTGTAQLIDPKTKAYSETDYVSSCIGLLPAENPELIIYNVVLRPKGESYEGSRIAAPPVKAAAEALVNYLGIPRGRNEIAGHSDSIVLEKGQSFTVGDTMGDYRGLSKRDLLPLLTRKDLKVEIRGDGWVVSQSPEPGAPLTSGSSLILELK